MIWIANFVVDQVLNARNWEIIYVWICLETVFFLTLISSYIYTKTKSAQLVGERDGSTLDQGWQSAYLFYLILFAFWLGSPNFTVDLSNIDKNKQDLIKSGISAWISFLYQYLLCIEVM